MEGYFFYNSIITYIQKYVNSHVVISFIQHEYFFMEKVDHHSSLTRFFALLHPIFSLYTNNLYTDESSKLLLYYWYKDYSFIIVPNEWLYHQIIPKWLFICCITNIMIDFIEIFIKFNFSHVSTKIRGVAYI